MTTRLDKLSLEQIAQCLLDLGSTTSDLPPEHLQSISHRDAAVLMPLVRENAQWHLLFIRRTTSEFDYHSGQVAFAGGKWEVSDLSLTYTALREAQEEIGIDPSLVTVLGQLPAHYSISGFKITPILATMPWPCALTLACDEVARVFTIPLNWLANPQHYELRPRTLPSKHTVAIPYFMRYDNELLWGATARMVLNLVERLSHHLVG